MEWSAAAVERAMTYQEVIMRALAGTWTWLQAADVLGIHPRSLRRWRARYEQDSVLGLLDRRRRRPSHRTAPRAEVQRILQLFRNRYQGFNVAHFHHLARRDHRVTLSYTFVKLALQEAGLVGKARARPGVATGGGASPAPASVSSSTSTAATTPGWPSAPSSARPCRPSGAAGPPSTAPAAHAARPWAPLSCSTAARLTGSAPAPSCSSSAPSTMPAGPSVARSSSRASSMRPGW